MLSHFLVYLLMIESGFSFLSSYQCCDSSGITLLSGSYTLSMGLYWHSTTSQWAVLLEVFSAMTMVTSITCPIPRALLVTRLCAMLVGVSGRVRHWVGFTIARTVLQ